MRLVKILVPVADVVVILAVVVPIAVVFTRGEDTDDTPLVNTTVGLIRGLRAEDGSAMFLGIPYAIVDRNNPFGPAAIVHPTFEEGFDAFDDSMSCPQIIDSQSISLDCLHLNVHVPKTSVDTPLPVMVYIHGGRYMIGTSSINTFGPKFLLRHNVIYVSLRYRLSAYGFLCLRTPQVPGNQGLKDQLNALRWIKRNIKAFGGDDENITIFGDSAGGASVDSQLLFADEGLFHKVITQSGTSLMPSAYVEPNLNAPFLMASQLGLGTNDTMLALQFLSNQTINQVMLAVARSRLSFQPCVEIEFANVDRFVTRHPVSTPLPQARDIPILSGYNSDEWLTTYANMPPEQLEQLDKFNENMHLGFEFGDMHDEMKLYVRRFYAADEPMSVNLRRAVTDLDSDFRFAHPTQRTIEKYIDYGGTAYHYVFSYVGGRNMARTSDNVTEGGAAHSDELGYLFDMPDFPETPSPNDQLIIDRITTLWTNFAKYGNPTPSTTTLLPLQWPPVTKDSLNYLNLTLDLEVGTRPFHQRLSFWDFFYYANREYVRGYSNESLTTL